MSVESATQSTMRLAEVQKARTLQRQPNYGGVDSNNLSATEIVRIFQPHLYDSLPVELKPWVAKLRQRVLSKLTLGFLKAYLPSVPMAVLLKKVESSEAENARTS